EARLGFCVLLSALCLLGSQHRIEVRNRPHPPPRSIRTPTPRPVRPHLRRRPLLAPLAERARLAGTGPRLRRRRGESVWALRPPRREDRPQSGELVDSDFGRVAPHLRTDCRQRRAVLT